MTNTFANLGGEEGRRWTRAADEPEVRAAAEIFESLVDSAAFRWLPERGTELVAWLNTPEALERARELDLPLFGAEPDTAAHVHDKAFALHAALEADLQPAELEPLCHVLEPSLDSAALCEEVSSRTRAWPDWTQGSFTLKPRQGSSGRGRVAGRADAIDTDALAGAWPRLAERGGALLEPWLDREADLSTQLVVTDDGTTLLLGSCRLWVESSGLYRGHSGTVDSRGRVTSDDPEDEALRTAGAMLATAAARAGYRGPCGVDGFRYRGPAGPTLRPAVELNARFTLGTLAIGEVKDHLAEIKEALALTPGELRYFAFALRPPRGGWPPSKADSDLLIPLVGDTPGAAPALFVSHSRERAWACVEGQRAPRASEPGSP